jgi:hypothetical protein
VDPRRGFRALLASHHRNDPARNDPVDNNPANHPQNE